MYKDKVQLIKEVEVFFIILGYLTSLASLPQLSENEIGDFKKARLLLKSVIQTDPKNSFGWIAAARVEELDGKLPAARSILA